MNEQQVQAIKALAKELAPSHEAWVAERAQAIVAQCEQGATA